MNKRNLKRRYLVRELWREQQGQCALCGERMTVGRGGPREATRDHITPKARGGHLVRGNVQLACWICNQAKGAREASQESGG